MTERIYIAPLHPGQTAPADAFMVGSKSMVLERVVDSVARNDAIEQAAGAVIRKVEAEEQKARADIAALRTIHDVLDLAASRMDAFEARKAERVRQDAARAAEEERQRIADELSQLPDPDDPHAHENTGDLHALPAKLPTDAALPGDPSLLDPDDPATHGPMPGAPATDAGNVPLSYVGGKGSVPLSYVGGGPNKDQAGDLPEALALPDPEPPERKGILYPQPTAIQLNEV